MLAPPAHDVGCGECGLRIEATLACREIGLAAAEAALGSGQRDRRASEPEVVHGDAVAKIECAQRLEHAFATRRQMVHVDERDVERRRDCADEIAPRFGPFTLEREYPHIAVIATLFDAPAVTEDDREVMTIRAGRSLDQRSNMLLGAAAAVEHMQHARPRRVTRATC